MTLSWSHHMHHIFFRGRPDLIPGVPCLFWLTHSFLCLEFTYKHHFSSPVTMWDKNSNESRWFLLFSFMICGTHGPNFWTLPMDFRYRMMVTTHFILTSSLVVWRGSSWIIAFKWCSFKFGDRPVFDTSFKSKFPSLKCENDLRGAPSAITPSP